MNSPNKPKAAYRFYIRTIDGTETEWRGLTHKQARDMYSYTDSHFPSNVVASGWEEIIPSPVPEPLTQNS